MHILLPTDGSDAALNALKHAADLASRMSQPCQLTLLVVHDDSGLRLVKNFVGKTEVNSYLQEMADKELSRSLKWAEKAGITPKTIFKTGHVSETILSVIEKLHPDLVVMGSKGRSGLADMLIGSVAQRVSAKSPVPVMLVPESV
jgi:nucleotide-binding universal stress UspA family protein